MARVTVEDCIKVIPSRFELVALATQRAKAISAGAPIAVSANNDKNPVIALREIAEGLAVPDALRSSLVDSYRNMNAKDRTSYEADDDIVLDEDDTYTGDVEDELLGSPSPSRGRPADDDEDDDAIDEEDIMFHDEELERE